ncbi:hypothetical protein STEG23_006742, partial [Scotinomys teguina]
VPIGGKSAEIQFTEQICVIFVMSRRNARQGEVSRGYGDLVGMGASDLALDASLGVICDIIPIAISSKPATQFIHKFKYTHYQVPNIRGTNDVLIGLRTIEDPEPGYRVKSECLLMQSMAHVKCLLPSFCSPGTDLCTRVLKNTFHNVENRPVTFISTAPCLEQGPIQ